MNMKHKEQRQWWHRFFFSRLFLFVVGGATLALAFWLVRSYYQNYRIQQEIESLHDEVSTLKQKRLESLEILSYVLSDDFVEEKARTELNLKRPGEHVVTIPDDQTLPVTAPRPLPSGQAQGNPLKWWYYFIHKD